MVLKLNPNFFLFFCIISYLIINAKCVKSTFLPHMSMEEIIKATENRDNDLFSFIMDSVEERLRNFQAKIIPEELFNYRNEIKKMIMNRAAKDEFSSITKNNFQSFLEIRNIPSWSLPSVFFGKEFYETLIDKLPQAGEVPEPWSGPYWAMRNALISVRYDRGPRNTIGVFDTNTQKYSRYYKFSESVGMYEQPDDFNKVSRENLENYINTVCSPSEKYDCLVGDLAFTLTNYMKNHSKKYAKDGDIPNWYGICHGWSPAAYFYPKPMRTITLFAADGRTRIRFLPHDVMALVTQFWANASYTTRFVGTICPFANPKDIQADPETGLYLDERCRAVNPGTFVIVMANQMGIKKLGCSIDPASDNEVWNQPMKSYLFKYFNLLTNKFFNTAPEARIPVSNLANNDDKFLKFLSKRVTPQTTHVVGVLMKITYAQEVNPTYSTTTTKNFFKTDEFIAALFLDNLGNIIGGEWKYNLHPNFIWKHDEKNPPMGSVDNSTPAFNGSSRSLQRLTPFAKRASGLGQPLKNIIELIVRMAAEVPKSLI